MFLQYAIPGAWWPLFSLRLKELRFTDIELATAFASSALGAILASLVAGQVADRWLSAEKCISICAGIGAVLLFTLAELTSPWAVCSVCICIWLMMVPTMTLGVTLALTHLHNPEQQYGRVRLWGTIGWVVPGLLLGWWFSNPGLLEPVWQWLGRSGSEVADSQRWAAVLALMLGGYALTLPHTPPARQAKSWLAPLEAIHLLRQRSFTIFAFCAFCLHVTVAFSMQLTPLLMENIGVPLEWISPTLTIQQSMEVILLSLLPAITLWLGGMRNTLLLGLAAWCLALTILTIGRPAWLVILSQALNGVGFCCFVIRGQVFINQQAGSTIRASAQGLVLMLSGLGLLVGNLLVGAARHVFNSQFAPTYAVGLSVIALALVVFAVGFENKPGGTEESAKKSLSSPAKNGGCQLALPAATEAERSGCS